jgi:hypothetical protein
MRNKTMTEKQFAKHIGKIQTFMWLDIWEINYRFNELDAPKWLRVEARCTNILYPYFRIYIDFNPKILDDSTDSILHVIFHEFSHIYTMSEMKIFEWEKEFLDAWIWHIAYEFIKEKMIITNEQQTELLARRFKELYLKSK